LLRPYLAARVLNEVCSVAVPATETVKLSENRRRRVIFALCYLQPALKAGRYAECHTRRVALCT